LRSSPRLDIDRELKLILIERRSTDFTRLPRISILTGLVSRRFVLAIAVERYKYKGQWELASRSHVILNNVQDRCQSLLHGLGHWLTVTFTAVLAIPLGSVQYYWLWWSGFRF
jgi:hypothetical protein